MKKLLAFALIALMAGSAMAATGWYRDYVVVSVDGGADEYYWIGDDPSFGTQFDGATFNITLGDTLELGADMRYWGDGGDDRQGGAYYWQIDTGSANEVVWTHTSLGGNDYQGTAPAETDVASGLSSGSYNLTVWAKSWGLGVGDSWLTNGGANYVADLNISAIPEPATMSLLGLGALAMVIRRKIRK